MVEPNPQLPPHYRLSPLALKYPRHDLFGTASPDCRPSQTPSEPLQLIGIYDRHGVPGYSYLALPVWMPCLETGRVGLSSQVTGWKQLVYIHFDNRKVS